MSGVGQQVQQSKVDLFLLPNYSGPHIELRAPSTTQIYNVFDYEPYFQSFNDAARSAILSPATSNNNFLTKNTFFLFKDAGFQGGFDALYYETQRNDNILFSDPFVYAQGSSAIIIQHQDSLSISLQSIQPFIKSAFTDQLNNMVNGANTKSFLAYTLNGIHFTGDITFQFMYDPIQQDTVIFKLPLQLSFVGFTPNIKFNLYLNIKFSMATVQAKDSSGNLVFSNGVPVYVQALQLSLLNFTNRSPILPFLLPFSEFSDWGIIALSGIVETVFYLEIFDYIHGSLSSIKAALAANAKPVSPFAFKKVYTMPWTLNPSFLEQNQKFPLNSKFSSFATSILNIPGMEVFNVNWSYYSISNITDVLICMYDQ